MKKIMAKKRLTDEEFKADFEKRLAEATAEVQWTAFCDRVRPLCCREKLRPKHWQRALFDYFEWQRSVAELPEDSALIERAITEMMEGSRPWCNPELFDEDGARAALKRALDTILAVQDSIGTDVLSEDDGELSESVGMQDKTAQLVAELGW